jgi:hypothetical protein
LVLAIGVAISCLTATAAERGLDHLLTGHRLRTVGVTLSIAALSIVDLALVVT